MSEGPRTWLGPKHWKEWQDFEIICAVRKYWREADADEHSIKQATERLAYCKTEVLRRMFLMALDGEEYYPYHEGLYFVCPWIAKQYTTFDCGTGTRLVDIRMLKRVARLAREDILDGLCSKEDKKK